MSNDAAQEAELASGHLDFLDGWRGMAIALLLIGHFFPLPGINLGTLGVNFFFVLSGWLMTRLLFVQRMPIDVFYRRRISRIVPAHLVFIGIVVLAFVLGGRAIDARETLAAVFFLNNYILPADGHAAMPFGHIWSLSVEEHAYVLLSLLAVLSRSTGLRGTWLVGAAAATCAGFAFGYSRVHAGQMLEFRDWLHTEVAAWGIFASGFLLLWLRSHRPRVLPAVAVPALVLLGMALHWWSVPPVVQKLAGVGALALAVNLLPQAPEWLRRALSARPLRLLGLWSFSLYLWQQPFYLWSGRPGAPAWLGLVLAFGAGISSYYLLERPVRRYLNRHWGRRPAKDMAAAPG